MPFAVTFPEVLKGGVGGGGSPAGHEVQVLLGALSYLIA